MGLRSDIAIARDKFGSMGAPMGAAFNFARTLIATSISLSSLAKLVSANAADQNCANSELNDKLYPDMNIEEGSAAADIISGVSARGEAVFYSDAQNSIKIQIGTGNFFVKPFGGQMAKNGAEILSLAGLNRALDPVLTPRVQVSVLGLSERLICLASARKEQPEIVNLRSYLSSGDFDSIYDFIRSVEDEDLSLRLRMQIAKTQILGFDDMVTGSNLFIHPVEGFVFPDADSFTDPHLDVSGFMDKYDPDFVTLLRGFVASKEYKDAFHHKREAILADKNMLKRFVQGSKRVVDLINGQDVDITDQSCSLYNIFTLGPYPDLDGFYIGTNGNSVVTSWVNKDSFDFATRFFESYGYSQDNGIIFGHEDFGDDGYVIYLDVNKIAQAKELSNISYLPFEDSLVISKNRQAAPKNRPGDILDTKNDFDVDKVNLVSQRVRY